jgi:Fem-1 family protein b
MMFKSYAFIKLKIYFLFTFVLVLQIVQVLLAKGAHIDARNRSHQRPIDLLKLIPDCKINPIQFTTLKCLAARVIAEQKINYKHEVPAMLEEFIQAH